MKIFIIRNGNYRERGGGREKKKKTSTSYIIWKTTKHKIKEIKIYNKPMLITYMSRFSDLVDPWSELAPKNT